MKKIGVFILVELLSLKSFSQISSQQLGGKTLNPITTAVPFLLISPDSKQGAMGDAGAATDPDVNSTHWNGFFVNIHVPLRLFCDTFHNFN